MMYFQKTRFDFQSVMFISKPTKSPGFYLSKFGTWAFSIVEKYKYDAFEKIWFAIQIKYNCYEGKSYSRSPGFYFSRCGFSPV